MQENPEATPNVPPADELFDVREKIRQLTERERVLRQLMISDAEARTGNSYLVEIRKANVTRTDMKELRKMYPDLVDEYTFSVAETRVELRRITEDGEIVSLRKKPKTVAQ